MVSIVLGWRSGRCFQELLQLVQQLLGELSQIVLRKKKKKTPDLVFKDIQR